jgi:hypothetical protein
VSGTLPRRLSTSAALALLLCTACDNAPAALRSSDLRREQAVWSGFHLSRYAYVYETTGFLIAYSGRPIRLVVINDSVASAQDATTDSLLPASAGFPTIDGLFAQALAAESAGSLVAITFDSTYAYPSRMDLSGPPDASGAILASGLQPLP